MSVGLPHGAEAHEHPEMSFVRKYIFSTDHKIIGIQFLFSTLIFLVIGGTLAMGVRLQLGWPHADHSWLANLLKWDKSYGNHMPPEFYKDIGDLFGRLGTLVQIPESLMDAATAVMSCGPAFLALVAEALVDAGVGHGLPQELAARMAVDTMAGTELGPSTMTFAASLVLLAAVAQVLGGAGTGPASPSSSFAAPRHQQ